MSTVAEKDREWFEEFYFTCIEEAFEEIDIYADADKLEEGLKEFPEWVGDLVCVHWLLSEFENGGLMQFFINSTGIVAPRAVVALGRMGLPELAEALKHAVEIFGSPFPQNKTDRHQLLRTKAGLKWEDMEVQLWRSKLFQNMEDSLDAVGTRTMYSRMNEFAKAHADHNPA